MAKVITRRTQNKLDFFVSKNATNVTQIKENEVFQDTLPEKEVSQKSKTIKKNGDGLIERLDKKIVIAEDNRQLLND